MTSRRPTLTHIQADAVAAAKERMISAGIRGGISIPAVPEAALPDPSYYDEPEPPDETRLDPSAGSQALEDAFVLAEGGGAAIATRREAERTALDLLDQLREDKLAADSIPAPSNEPVRLDPVRHFLGRN